MVKKRGGDPWMPASVYSKGLSGLSVNLLVNDVAASVVFAETVLGAKAVYADPDFAVLKIDTAARASPTIQKMNPPSKKHNCSTLNKFNVTSINLNWSFNSMCPKQL